MERLNPKELSLKSNHEQALWLDEYVNEVAIDCNGREDLIIPSFRRLALSLNEQSRLAIKEMAKVLEE